MRRILEGQLTESGGRLTIGGRELEEELRALVVAVDDEQEPVTYRISVEPID